MSPQYALPLGVVRKDVRRNAPGNLGLAVWACGVHAGLHQSSDRKL